MNVRLAPSRVRHGLSLLEVLIALAIFLISLIGIGHLITLSGQQTLEISERGHAAQLAQAKLAEVVAGVVPLSSQLPAPFEDEAEWSWSLTAEQDAVPGLWNVEIRVSRERTDGTTYEVSLHQKVLDPSMRGSTLDAAAALAAAAAAAESSGSTTSQQSPTSQSTTSTQTPGGTTQQTTTGGGAMGATGGAAAVPAAPAPAAAAPAASAPAAGGAGGRATAPTGGAGRGGPQ